MVYSASSGTTLLSEGGDSSYYLKRYLVSAGIGLFLLTFLARHGLGPCGGSARSCSPWRWPLVLVLVLGFGMWEEMERGAGSAPARSSPTLGIAKLALVLYAASFLAAQPERARSFGGAWRPLLIVGAVLAGLVVIEPDLAPRS